MDIDAAELAIKLPPPPDPATLRGLGSDGGLMTIASGRRLWRIYKRAGAHPTRWNAFRYTGPLSHRYDHHRPPVRRQKRGTIYLGCDVLTCAAEAFQITRTIDCVTSSPWIVGFEIAMPLTVLDLTTLWPIRAGASTLINNGPHALTQLWSRAIYDAYPDVQGLLYGSPMAQQSRPCLALYERAAHALPTTPSFHRPLSDDDLYIDLALIAEMINYYIVYPKHSP